MVNARWVDMLSDLLVDVTAVRIDEDKQQNGHPEVLLCKDGHHCGADYLKLSIYSRWWVIHVSDVFPLCGSLFGGFRSKSHIYIYTCILEE